MALPKLKLVNTDGPKDGEIDRGAADGSGANAGVPVEAIAILEAQRAVQAALEAERIVEALLFASPVPLDEASLARHLPAGTNTAAILTRLQNAYATRGVTLVRLAGEWAFRTAEDLSWLLERHTTEERKLSKAALEMLAIIAYHQPVTRA
ncbi:MAG: SMC-Scp complex subunit ScpB, partial [Armatimonadaceae bacterium]